MSTEIQVPDYLAGMLNEASMSNLANAASSASTSFPRISLKGRTFRLKVGGEEVKTSREPINVIILGVSPETGNMRKTLYLSKYNPDSADPPDCSSSDGIVPDSFVSTKQSDTCAKCSYNQWGTDVSMTGKKAKKCKDSKLLFVVDAEDPKGTIYALSITVASLKAFSEYAQLLLNNKVPFAACITQLDFAETDFPQLLFKYVGVMKEEMCREMMAIADKAEWKSQLALVSNTDSDSAPSNLKSAIPDNRLAQEAPTSSVTTAGVTSNVDDVLNNWGTN